MAEEDRDELTLVDRWEELGQEHQLKVKTEHDAWPKTTCWVYYRPRCSCGEVLPCQSRTEREYRPDIDVQIKLDHTLHLVKKLLDEDWVPESKYIDWISQEQA